MAPMMKRVKTRFYLRLKLLIPVGVITPTGMGIQRMKRVQFKKKYVRWLAY
jgi:hypothetical protein